MPEIPEPGSGSGAPAVLARRPETIADLLERLGSIPPRRVRSQPPPGTAQESDLLEAFRIGEPACELVDGVIVEKAMGA